MAIPNYKDFSFVFLNLGFEDGKSNRKRRREQASMHTDNDRTTQRLTQ